MGRRYELTIAQLIDRLAIVNLKSIKDSKNKGVYEQEAQDINHDLNLVLSGCTPTDMGQFIRGTQINQLSNELIWSNESKARQGGSEQDHLLKLTHSINRVRNQSMNMISNLTGERKDLKLDYMDAELTKQFGYDFGSVI